MLVLLHLDHRLKSLGHAVVVDQFLIGNLRLTGRVVEFVFGRLDHELRRHEPDVVHRVRDALLVGWIDRRARLGRFAIRVVVDARSADAGSLEVEIDNPRLAQERHQRIVRTEPVDHGALAEHFSGHRIPDIKTWVCWQGHTTSPFPVAHAPPDFLKFLALIGGPVVLRLALFNCFERRWLNLPCGVFV